MESSTTQVDKVFLTSVSALRTYMTVSSQGVFEADLATFSCVVMEQFPVGHIALSPAL